MSKEPTRFEVIHEDKFGMSDHVRILRDSATGVCYVQTMNGYCGGLAPLLDAEGRPVVDRTSPAR